MMILIKVNLISSKKEEMQTIIMMLSSALLAEVLATSM